MSSELKIYKVSPAEKKLVRYYPGGVRAGIPVDSPGFRCGYRTSIIINFAIGKIRCDSYMKKVYIV